MLRYSGISTAGQCLQKYKLQYVDKVGADGLPSIDLEFGTALHAALHSMLQKDDWGMTFSIFWNTLKTTEFAKARHDWEQLEELAKTFLARFQRLHLKHFEPLHMEERITGKLGEYEFEGTPDFVGLYKGVMSVVDFKTSGYAYPKERIVCNAQMPLYAELARQTYGTDVKQVVYVVFIKSENRIQVLTQDLTKEYLAKHLDNLVLLAKELVERTDYPKNPHSCMMGSFRCPYFERCWK